MPLDMLKETLVSLFHRAATTGDADRPALHIRRGEDFVALSWNEIAADVRRTAATFRQLGVEPGDRVAQLAENRYEWIVVDLAVQLARGIHVAIHNSLAGPQVAYQIADSGAKLAVVSGSEQAAKLDSAAGPWTANVQFFSHDPRSTTIAGQPVRPLQDVVRHVSEPAGGAIEQEALETCRPGNLATILYTSGTTGEPKGVMLSHGNLASNALGTLEVFVLEPDDLRLCWLPLSHIYARTSDLYTWLAQACQMALAQSRDTILADCARIHPTFLNGVPYFYDKVCRHLSEKGLAETPGSLRELLGGRIRHCCSGGAALPDHVAEFFARQDVLLTQGYGLTESSPVIATGCPKAHRLGTVGRPIPGVEVKIAADGEVLTRGPHVMVGYWNKPADTAAAIRDGWLRTGDLGRLEDGYLRITGRKKELIVTAAGKNIAPTYLEALLAEDPLIAQVMVIGDGRNYLTALIVPDADALRAEIIKRRIPVTSAAEALAHPRVHELYSDCLTRRLADVSHCEQVPKFALIGRGFTIESGELTPTLKLRRNVIQQNFATEIAAMYEV